MSRKRRRPAPAPSPHTDFFGVPGLAVLREGRNIQIINDLEPEARQALAEGFLSQKPSLLDERQAALERIEAIFARQSPSAVVACASLTYLMKDPNTYRETEDDKAAAHVEFLALLALPYLSTAVPTAHEGVAHDTEDALDAARTAFRATQELLVVARVEDHEAGRIDKAQDEYRYDALTSSLLIRGFAYVEHIERVLRGCLEPFSQDCLRLLGFTAKDAWALWQGVGIVRGERLEPRLNGLVGQDRAMAREIKRQRRKGLLPKELAALTPTEQRNIWRHGLQTQHLADAIDVAVVTAADLAEATGIEEGRCDAWLEAFTCPPSEFKAEHHTLPVGGHPVTRLPILRVPEGYLVAAPSSVPDALRPRMEDLLRAADANVLYRYERARGAWVEEEATRLLAGVLPGSRSWTALQWDSAEDNSDLDGLVHCDDVALRIQCKAGRISPAARRGAPSWVEDVRKVISDAAMQHDRLARALETCTAVALGFTSAQARALSASLTIEVAVCLDDVTVWSTETHKLRRVDALPAGDTVPWVLSLTDLMAVTDLLQATELVHFLTRRQRLEREARVEAHDELDWVGHYIQDGLFFDSYFEGDQPVGIFRLLSFTEPIDTWYFSRQGVLDRPVPKPAQPMPTPLRGLIDRLEAQRPRHWLTAALLLLNGDESSREDLARIMQHTTERARRVGWSNGSVGFGSYGLTLWADTTKSGSSLRESLRPYAVRKCRDESRRSWVVLCLGRDGKLEVLLHETVLNNSVLSDLVRRDAAAAGQSEAP